MKKSRLLSFSLVSLFALTSAVPAAAEVRHIEIDVAGYLCGL
jgi:hypothetical protein